MYSADICKEKDLRTQNIQVCCFHERVIQFNHLQNGCKNSQIENVIASEIEYIKALCKLQNVT